MNDDLISDGISICSRLNSLAVNLNQHNMQYIAGNADESQHPGEVPSDHAALLNSERGTSYRRISDFT